MANEKFSVVDMLDTFADENEMDPKEVFKKHPVTGNVKAEEEAYAASENAPQSSTEEEQKTPKKRKRGEWRPDASVTAGMAELQPTSGAVYDKKDVVMNMDKSLKNGPDESAIQQSREAMDDLGRKEANIEEAKKRHGIKSLQIPPGEYQTRMLIAASDMDHMAAQKGLDELLNRYKVDFPQFILEYEPGYGPEGKLSEVTPAANSAPESTNPAQPIPSEDNKDAAKTDGVPGESKPAENPAVNTPLQSLDIDEAKIIINKKDAPSIAWSREEVEKIRKSRTVELNIVEGADLEFGNIKSLKGNAVDKVLSQYHRKVNDVTGALPASKYRATFSGLSYPEVVDLSTSNEMNNLDGLRKKWSLCFQHIHNQSIGPWEEYILYKDPETGDIVKTDINSGIPANVPDEDLHIVTKMEDFMRKTSFADLDYMLWRILCATTMDKELVSIDCHAIIDSSTGKECGNSYDWIYNPAELLDMNSIDPAVLEEMRETGEASTLTEIMKVYDTSPLRSNEYVKLHSSGLYLLYGHVSAQKYTDDIYTKIDEINKLAKSKDKNQKIDPDIVSKSMIYSALSTIKSFVVVDANGQVEGKIDDIDDIIKVLETFDPIDWQTITEISDMMITPYQFKFIMKDVECPKCHKVSSLPIADMSRLLFILARSLSSVQVTLTKQ